MAGDTEDGVGITQAMIARRNLDPSLHNGTVERLPPNTDTPVTNNSSNAKYIPYVMEPYGPSLFSKKIIYQNLIRKIENLEALKNLRFLSLSGNRIEKIGNLNFLQNLMLLDLSHNLIQYLSVGELPTNLFILDLTENSCTQKYGYRQQILESLPLLQELDREPVRERESLEEHPVIQEDDEEIDIDNVFSPPSIVSESLSSLHEELVERSYQRRERARREHQERLEELREIPIKDTMQQYNCSSLHEIGPRVPASSKKEPQPPALYKSPLLLTKHRQVLAPSEKKRDHLNCHNASTSSKVITVKTPTKALATPPQTQYGAPRSRNMSKSAFSSSPSCKLSPTQPSALTTPSSKLQTSASVQGKRTAKTAPLSGKSQPTASSTSQHAGKFSSRQLKKQTQ